MKPRKSSEHGFPAALSTAKLTRHPRFGSAAMRPLGQVLESVKQALASK